MITAAASTAACPRCGQGFLCGALEAAPCACSSIELGPDTLRLLRERYTTCLCLACLRELSTPPHDALQASRDTRA